MYSDLYSFLKINSSPIDIYFAFFKISNKEIYRTFSRMEELNKFIDNEIDNYKCACPYHSFDIRIVTGKTHQFIFQYEEKNKLL